jgi:hypothetical protein
MDYNPQEVLLTPSSHIAHKFWVISGMRWKTLYGPTEVGDVKDWETDSILEQT